MRRVSTAVPGILAGAAAYSLGLVITFVIAGVAATRLAGEGPFGETIPAWKATMWVFYDAHFVGTQTAELFGPDGALWGGGELVLTVSLLDIEYLIAVPVIALLLGGALLAYHTDSDDGREGLVSGMTLALGYFPLVLVGLLLSVHFGIGPSPLRALVIAGVVYPVFFGAIGGFLAGHFGWSSRSLDGPNTGDDHEMVIDD